MSDDTVMVQPIRTFLEGNDLVHPESEPYRVSRFQAYELRANGLVQYVEVEAPAEPQALPAPPAMGAELETAPALPRKRGRPPRAG